MGAYVIRRMLLIPVTLLMLVTIFFFMLRTIPGDLVDFLYQEGGTSTVTIVGSYKEGGETTQDAYARQLREKFGLDRPAHVQFVQWVGHMLQGEFGYSFLNQKSATQIFRERLPASIQLGLMGLTGALSIGIPLGILAARFADTWIDNLVRIVSLTGLSTPSFVSAAIIMVVLSVFFYWVPPEYVPFTSDPLKNMSNMIFPVGVVSYATSAPLTRLVRSQMLEVMSQDYIRTARAKGLKETTVFYKHGLRNALLPVVTVVGFALDTLVAGSVIVETVFGINGMGAALVRAASQRDFPVLQLFVMVFGMAVLSINLLVDLAYAVIDPRIRYS